MKKTYLYIYLTVLSLSLLNCKSSLTDYGTQISDDEIYSFMRFVVSDLKIPYSVNIQKEPKVLFSHSGSNEGLKIIDYTLLRLNTESKNKSDTVYISVKSNRKTVFKQQDTSFVLSQNRRLIENFEFDLSKFGYVDNNNVIKVYFSLPYFSKDKRSVVISITKIDTSAFMAGSSAIIHYKKIEKGWERNYIRRSLH